MLASTKISVSELPLLIPKLHAGDFILLSGTVYTARDAAHKRLFELMDAGKDLPFNISGSVIYYAGPTPPKNDMPFGSCGPTTSSRMDKFTPRLLSLGLSAMIGKGERSPDVVKSIKENGSIYLSTVGGAGAYIAKCIVSSQVIAYPDLLSESIKALEVVDLPAFVAVDSYGNSLYR